MSFPSYTAYTPASEGTSVVTCVAVSIGIVLVSPKVGIVAVSGYSASAAFILTTRTGLFI